MKMNKREIRQLLCSFLIGDGHIAERDGVFIFEHSAKQADYADWKADLIDNVFIEKKLLRRCKRRQTIQKVKDKTYPSYRVELYWSEYLKKFLHSRTYTVHNGETVKNIEYILQQLNSPLHLAIWFMDDGGEMNIGQLKDGSLRRPWYGLFTYGFTKGQVNLSAEWFKYKYGMIPNITYFKPRNSYYLRFNRDQAEEIFSICYPYFSLHKSMKDKFRYSFSTFLSGEGSETRESAPQIEDESIVREN